MTSTQNNNDKNRERLANWLYSVAGLVFAMIIVGAITRLTNSGLSMVEWRPLMGTLPPLSEAEWNRVFALYQDTPEYSKKHFWMTLDDFKMIFFWEWFHRFLGRLIGLAYALPLLVFWLRGMIPQGYKLPLLGLLVLGGLQGVLGWWMVQSGLVDEPYVSHYRLAAHLSLAFVIFALLIRAGLSMQPMKAYPDRVLYNHGWGVVALFVMTIFWGAYTAGLDAGLLYGDEFPLMGGQWIPPDFVQYSPAWINLFENPSAVQWAHRWLAILTVLAMLSLWAHALYRETCPPALTALAAFSLVQAGLGIATLHTHVALPVATLHQGGAAVLILLFVVSLFQLRPDPMRQQGGGTA